MASDLIFRLIAKADTAGLKETETELNKVTKQFQDVSKASENVATSFSQLKNSITGIALTLPLASFVKDAIQSEEVAARFGLQMQALGKDFEAFQPILKETEARVRAVAGVTSTELSQALSKGLIYFKDTGKELSLLNTALGMSKLTGSSLATSFQQLGLITTGYTRIARQFGVSMHTEIRDPVKRANAVIDELRAKMEPLAKQTGTVAESFKIFKANVGDIGEKIGAEFLAPINAMLNSFNKLSPAMQEMIVRATVLTTTLIGLSKIMQVVAALKFTTQLNTFLAGFGEFLLSTPKIIQATDALGAFGKSLDIVKSGLGATGIITAAVIAGVAIKTYGDQAVEAAKGANAAWKQYYDTIERQRTASLGSLGTEINMVQNLDDTIADLAQTEQDLFGKEAQFRQQGAGGLADQAHQEALLAQQRKDNLINAKDAIKSLGIANLTNEDDIIARLKLRDDDYNTYKIKKRLETLGKVNNLEEDQQKALSAYILREQEDLNKKILAKQRDYQNEIATLRVSLMKDGLEKELAQAKINADKERTNLIDKYKNTLELRTALTKKQAQDEFNIRVKFKQQEFDKEIEFALKSRDEQLQYTSDFEQAQSILRGQSVDTLKDMSDAEKEILKTQGGQKALEDFRKTGIEEQEKALQAEVQLHKDAAFWYRESLLTAEKYKLAQMESTDVGKIMLEQGMEAVDAFQKQRELQRQKVIDMQEELALAKEKAGATQTETASLTTAVAAAEPITKAEFQPTNVTVTISNIPELTSSITAAFENTLNKQLQAFFDELNKRVSA